MKKEYHTIEVKIYLKLLIKLSWMVSVVNNNSMCKLMQCDYRKITVLNFKTVEG